MPERALYRARRVANATVSAWLDDHAVLCEAGRITGVVPATSLPRDARETHFPGLAIAVTVLGLNLLGDGLRDALDPRLKVQQG